MKTSSRHATEFTKPSWAGFQDPRGILLPRDGNSISSNTITNHWVKSERMDRIHHTGSCTGTFMTQHSDYHEKNLAYLVYQTNGSPKTSETCWSNQEPELQNIHTGGDIMSSQDVNFGTNPCSLQSTSGEILASQRRLHNNGSLDLSDRSQNTVNIK